MSTTASRKTQEARQQQSFELGDLDHMIGYQLRRAQTTLFHNFSKRIGHRNITPGQFGLLIKIKNNPGVSQTGLARAEGIERSTLGEIIDRFEKRELVERRRHAEDRRAYALHLTPAGQTFLDQVTPEVFANDLEVAHRLTDEERQQLLCLLRKLTV
ncbi:MAG: MarR family transcriptional regulator [Gammaproteobacteria bacterium]|jgi:DNA-binding MarR family transcriptional regulator|nr:MarR family transcriptional regulator [Gammaproteobacteria bacterium]MCP4879898.1 MarR family transcriptional regulator [Gammaproteobacteria bacterium]MDP6165437.1 MarR family transcriptional regulator [Gammaproteobacteria bacterium]